MEAKVKQDRHLTDNELVYLSCLYALQHEAIKAGMEVGKVKQIVMQYILSDLHHLSYKFDVSIRGILDHLKYLTGKQLANVFAMFDRIIDNDTIDTPKQFIAAYREMTTINTRG